MPSPSGAKGLRWYGTGRNVYAGGCSTQQVWWCKMPRPSGAKSLRWQKGVRRRLLYTAGVRCKMPTPSGAKDLRWYDTGREVYAGGCCTQQVWWYKTPRPSGAKGLRWYDTGRKVYTGGCCTQV
ncbi:hypothetical protein BaRGS_00025679 [Batillaria attramentaria]|uniref:Uncharacterized protein n=1 Tax=Batillaria attramentaria TaxID=370345 RepID=A0ABD0K704_9CAEN